MNYQEQEFGALVRRHKSTIYSVCYMFAKDRCEADDLFQEILIRIWQGLGSYRGDSAESTWIYRVSLNTCVSYERKERRRRQSVSVPIDPDFFAEEETEHPRTAELRRRIQMLPPLDRAIVLMWLEALPYDEIGAVAGISAKAVSVRLVRIREKLKQYNNKD